MQFQSKLQEDINHLVKQIPQSLIDGRKKILDKGMPPEDEWNNMSISQQDELVQAHVASGELVWIENESEKFLDSLDTDSRIRLYRLAEHYKMHQPAAARMEPRDLCLLVIANLLALSGKDL